MQGNSSLIILCFFFVNAWNKIASYLIAQTVEERGYIKLSKLSGKLLTPEQGCGVSTVPTSRIVGGTDAELGKSTSLRFCKNKWISKMRINENGFVFKKTGSFPWMALIIYSDQDNGKKQYHYDCGKISILKKTEIVKYYHEYKFYSNK